MKELLSSDLLAVFQNPTLIYSMYFFFYSTL